MNEADAGQLTEDIWGQSDPSENAGAALILPEPVDEVLADAAPARIIEVGRKDVTRREATAECTIHMSTEAVSALMAGTTKGDPLEAAKVAGLMGAKRTSDLLPFCHPIALTGASVRLEPDPKGGEIRIQATVKASDRTGVEMEALTAAAVAALSLYDTAKAFDRGAEIGGLRLVAKSGGKSGDWRRNTR